MKELRSIDNLDKEILLQAKKKADEILKNADEECKNIINKVEADIQTSKKEKEAVYNKKLEAFENDLRSSLPLEKQRFKISYMQSSVEESINNYLNTLNDSRKMEIATRNFDFKTDNKFTAYVYGFDVTEAKKLLEKKLGKNLLECQKTVFGKIVPEEQCGLKNPCGIILESDDKKIRIRLTLSKVFNQILDEKRAELADALFGGSL